MSQLSGWFGALPDGDPAVALQGMLAAGRGAGDVPVRRRWPAAALAAAKLGQAPVQWVEQAGLCIACLGHPRWCGGPGRTDDLTSLAAALRARGSDALKELEGDFALAAWDEDAQRGWIAVDRMGVHSLVYARPGSELVFASSLDSLRAHPRVPTRLSPQGLFDYLYYHVCPGPGTIFEGLHRLPAGHVLEFGTRDSAEPRPYWVMDFTEDHGRSVADWESGFVDHVRQAVADQAEAEGTGTFLSGGTDSSTVSGMLGRVTGRPTRAFSIGFDAQGFDEMAYARVAARHFGCEHHEYYVTPKDVVDAVPRIAAWYDQPFGNASAIPTYYCARFAREHGVRRLLAGDGGDELFGGNARYAKQHLLAHYHRVPAALRSLLEPLVMAIPRDSTPAPLRKIRSYIEQARPPMPLRYESYNLLSYLGHDRVLGPSLRAGVDTSHPLALLRDAHAPFAGVSLINQMLAIDLRFVLADGDLPKVTQMCAMAGADVAFPFLDDRLVGFSGRMPADLKLRGTQLRWLFKHALRNFLPQEVLTKSKHGFGLPVGTWLVDHKPLRDLARDAASTLKQRGFVEPAFIDELFDRRLNEHAGYFGTMVWILMMLGLWLESRRL